MHEGKLPQDLLKSLLSRLSKPGEEVIIPPQVGEDACVIEQKKQFIVCTTDPVTFTSEHIGHYALNVNANDVATMGATPRWFLATLLVPPGFGRKQITCIFDELDQAARRLGVSICGGHTEVSSAVSRAVVVGMMIGEVSQKDLVNPRCAAEGDVILLTKRLAVEGTSIIARERRRETEKVLGRSRARKAREFLFSPGISIVKEALAAIHVASVHAMHDPTEGGLIWGLRELSEVTGLGVRVDLDRIPIYEETRLLCNHFGLNPLGLIASGSLLIVVSPEDEKRVTGAIKRRRIECTAIGVLCKGASRFYSYGRPVRLPSIAQDEITRLL